MASLTEVYEGVGEVATRRQVYAGVGLFGVGAVFGLAGLIVGSTQLLSVFGVGTFGARRIAGLLAGLGVPAILLGIFTVLPADRRVRAAAAIGAAISVLGVAMFWVVYPSDWAGYGQDYTLLVTGIYTLGIVITFWCLFVAVINFKTRNDPGGTVRLEITKDGKTKIIHDVPRSVIRNQGVGSVGIFGSTTTESIESTLDDAVVTTGSTVSDGGATEPEIRSPLDDDGRIMESTPEPIAPVDTYCGNCSYFEYVRSSGGIRPFCGFNDTVMDDMNACEHWQPNQP